MRSESLKGLRQEGERLSWHKQYIRNALSSLGQISTNDKELAEQSLRRAMARADAADPLSSPD